MNIAAPLPPVANHACVATWLKPSRTNLIRQKNDLIACLAFPTFRKKIMVFSHFRKTGHRDFRSMNAASRSSLSGVPRLPSHNIGRQTRRAFGHCIMLTYTSWPAHTLVWRLEASCTVVPVTRIPMGLVSVLAFPSFQSAKTKFRHWPQGGAALHQGEESLSSILNL